MFLSPYDVLGTSWASSQTTQISMCTTIPLFYILKVASRTE